MKAVIISYPYGNEVYGSECVLYSMQNGEVPISLNALYEHYGKTEEINNSLQDAVKKALMTVNSLVIYEDLGMYRSMVEILEIAKDYNVEVVMRTIKK